MATRRDDRTVGKLLRLGDITALQKATMHIAASRGLQVLHKYNVGFTDFAALMAAHDNLPYRGEMTDDQFETAMSDWLESLGESWLSNVVVIVMDNAFYTSLFCNHSLRQFLAVLSNNPVMAIWYVDHDGRLVRMTAAAIGTWWLDAVKETKYRS